MENSSTGRPAKFEAKIEASVLEHLPVAEFKGGIYVVDSKDSLYQEAINYLSQQRVIGFDTETKPCFKPGHEPNRTAILQLSGKGKAYIFRLKHLGLPASLAAILSAPEIIKAGAAVHDDIRGLQFYRRFQYGGFIDLQKIVPDYGIEEKSVKKMAALILGVRVSKSQQLSNWEAEELTNAQLHYAALDAWICREMYLKLVSMD